MTTGDSDKRVGLMDVARALGLSIGTVDRALHNRPGVNPMTRAKVVQMARTLGYRPNLAARALSSKQRTRFAAVLPRDPNGFFADVCDGIREASRAAEGSGVTVEFREYPWLKDGEAEFIEAAVEEGVSGLIIAPGAPDAVRGAIRKASRKDIPVVCVATDAPGTERLTVVRADPFASGSIAAELIGRVLWGKGSAAIFTGSMQTATHAENLEGFRATLAAGFPEMRIAEVVETHDDAEEAYTKTLDVFSRGNSIAAVFVSTSNSVPVLRALDELGQTKRLLVVTMDLFPAISERIRDGSVLASIYQRPRNQGRRAFRALYEFRVDGICPPSQIRFAPHIVLRSNLDLLLRNDTLKPVRDELGATCATALDAGA